METALPEKKHLRVVSLQTTNFKRIKAARVDPDPTEHVILIGGEIDNGKSSLLDSMMAVLGGKDASPEVPVRKGMKKGEVVLDLEDIVARLRFTAAGGRELTIEDKEGKRLARPQDVMDKLTGKVGFDAEEFIRMKADKQLEVLKRIVGLDFAPLEAKKVILYSQRTAANSVVKTLEAQLASAPNPTDAPAELVDTSAVLAEIQKAQEHNKGREPLAEAYQLAAYNLQTRKQDEAACRKEENEIIAEIDRMEKQLAAMREELKAKSQEIVTSANNTAADQKALNTAEANGKAFILQDTTPLQAKLAGADTANNKHRQAAARKGLVESLKTAEAKASTLDNAIQEIDAQKEKMLLEAKFPVAGLGFGESGITFDKLPFEQAASSTKRRVSVAIGAALNPTLRVMVIKDGSLLGTKGVEQVRELAREFDLQVWIEVVTSDAEDRSRCTVVIEDGTVMGAPKVEDIPEAPEKSSTPEHVEPPKDLFGSLPNQ